MKAIIINAAVFQVGWLACVLAGANLYPWTGTLVALMIVYWHVIHQPNPRSELLLVLTAGVIGTIWDSLLVYTGILEYRSGILIEGTAPIWIIAMWLMFATTLNVSLKWLKHRTLLAAVLGMVAGPAAYYAGFRLGGVAIPDLVTAMTALAAGWAVLLPLLLHVSNSLDGTRVDNSCGLASGCDARV